MASENIEVERKFLVHSVPEGFEKNPSEEIVQGYVTLSEKADGFRLRQMGEKYFFTVKRGKGITREEIEIELLPEQFKKLWLLCGNETVSKTRYFIPHEDVTIELDIYKGGLSGLITVEVEFDTEKMAKAFNPPEWFARDVTDDERYTNRSLSVYGRPD